MAAVDLARKKGRLSHRSTGAESADRAFDAIYEQWFAEVYRWVRIMGAPASDSEDVVQDVFLVVRRRLDAFDGQNLAGWLYRITQRRVRDVKRLAWVKRLLRFGELTELDQLPSTRRGPDDELEQRERQQTLAALLATLKDEQRVAFVLFEMEGWAGEDIARLQDVPLNTVWARIYRARRRLQKGARLRGYGGRRT